MIQYVRTLGLSPEEITSFDKSLDALFENSTFPESYREGNLKPEMLYRDVNLSSICSLPELEKGLLEVTKELFGIKTETVVGIGEYVIENPNEDINDFLQTNTERIQENQEITKAEMYIVAHNELMCGLGNHYLDLLPRWIKEPYIISHIKSKSDFPHGFARGPVKPIILAYEIIKNDERRKKFEKDIDITLHFYEIDSNNT